MLTHSFIHWVQLDEIRAVDIPSSLCNIKLSEILMTPNMQAVHKFPIAAQFFTLQEC